MSTIPPINNEDKENFKVEVKKNTKLNKNDLIYVGCSSALLITTFVLLFFMYFMLYKEMDKNCDRIVEAKNRIKNNDLSCDFNECKPWPKNHLYWFNPEKQSPLCEPVNKNLYYYIKDDTIFIRDEMKSKINCDYTCYFRRNFKEIDIVKTVKIKDEAILECDVPWVKCYNEGNVKVYENIELVLRKLNKPIEEKKNFLKPGYSLPNDIKKYNLHVVVIGSLSYYHALRALNQTRSVLLKNGGIEIKYLNTQGDNNIPNAHGFLLNKFSNDVQDNSLGRPTKINDWGSKNSCNVPIDNTTFIFDYYKKMGYIVLYADDFKVETFEWPNCVGFINDFSHHSTRVRQFLTRYNLNGSEKIILDENKNKCYFPGQDIFKYYEDFLKTYQNQPIASLTWQSKLMHDNIDDIFEQDGYLSEYFERNSKYLNDSFLIVMGDHGYRMGPYMSTEVGKYEHANPYFLIKPPAELLGNKELIGNLKENSIKHISHLDLYATFLDILTEGPKNNFKNLKPYDLSKVVNDTIKGLSLLRPLPDENRSCYDMNIPFEYCLCQPKYVKLSRWQSRKIYNRLEEVFIKDINKQLENDNLKEICSQLTLHNGVKDHFIVKINEGKNTTLYEVSAITKPGKGSFRAYYNQNFTLLNDIIRTNKYGDQAEVCNKNSKYRKYCYCKILLEN